MKDQNSREPQDSLYCNWLNPEPRFISETRVICNEESSTESIGLKLSAGLEELIWDVPSSGYSLARLLLSPISSSRWLAVRLLSRLQQSIFHSTYYPPYGFLHWFYSILSAFQSDPEHRIKKSVFPSSNEDNRFERSWWDQVIPSDPGLSINIPSLGRHLNRWGSVFHSGIKEKSEKPSWLHSRLASDCICELSFTYLRKGSAIVETAQCLTITIPELVQ